MYTMNNIFFKKLSHYYFPQLAENARKYFIFNNIVSVFNQIAKAKNDEEISEIAKNYYGFEQSLSPEEGVEFSLALNIVSDAVKLSEALISDPLYYSHKLNDLIEDLLVQKKQGNYNKELNTQIAKYSMQSACASIIGVLNQKLPDEDFNKELLYQQDNLKRVIQSDLEDKNTGNYWYALHSYIKGNKKNTSFFIKTLLLSPQTHDIEMMVDQSMSPWLREKIPATFHNQVEFEYSKWLNRHNIKSPLVT